MNDPVTFFSETLRLSGVAHLEPESSGDPRLMGKRLGLLNGSSWITPFSTYFGRRYLPGVHLVNLGNEAIQLNFMQAHRDGLPCPPPENIERFTAYARDLVELGKVHAVLITCSTMNRSYPRVVEALEPYGVPAVQIDIPMMERAVETGGRVLVVATHGPTVANTQALLTETASRMGKTIQYDGITVEEAWHRLANGDVLGHNQTLAHAIAAALEHPAVSERPTYQSIVLAQLSMAAFLFSYPDPMTPFGIPVLTSGQCGFERVREILTQR